MCWSFYLDGERRGMLGCLTNIFGFICSIIFGVGWSRDYVASRFPSSGRRGVVVAANKVWGSIVQRIIILAGRRVQSFYFQPIRIGFGLFGLGRDYSKSVYTSMALARTQPDSLRVLTTRTQSSLRSRISTSSASNSWKAVCDSDSGPNRAAT